MIFGDIKTKTMANLHPGKKNKRNAVKAKTNRKTSHQAPEKSSFHVMSLEEMAQKEMIPGKGKEPSKYSQFRERTSELYIKSKKEPKIEVVKNLIDRETGLWKLGFRSPEGPVVSGLPVLHEEKVTIRELTSLERYSDTRAYRPPWVSMEYLPKIIPHRIANLNGRIRDLVRFTGMPEMHFLDYDAHEALTMSFPWRCIGKITSGSDSGPGSSGTGVLVGPNLMMTASHLWKWGAPGRWMHFSPGFREGPQHPESFVTRIRGIQSDGDPTGYDYIICQLQKPLGEMIGWMGSQSFGDEDDYYDPDWISVGYPGVFYNGMRPAVDFDIGIRDIDNDDPGLELETTYNTAFGGGWSGGPLWGVINNDFKIIGIKSGWEVDVYDPARGVFSGGNHMVDLIKHGLANFK